MLIYLLSLRLHGIGKNAILRNFGVLRKEFPESLAIASPIRDHTALFGDHVPIKLNPYLGTVATMPTKGYKPSYAGRRVCARC